MLFLTWNVTFSCICLHSYLTIFLFAHKIVQQQIWNNYNYLYEGNSQFKKKWNICEILYVNDLLNDEGNFKSLVDYKDCVKNKPNWIFKFEILSSVFKPLGRTFDFSNCKFSNMQNNNYFYLGYENVLGQRCSFFYDNLVNRFKVQISSISLRIPTNVVFSLTKNWMRTITLKHV